MCERGRMLAARKMSGQEILYVQSGKGCRHDGGNLDYSKFYANDDVPYIINTN